ncbi:MAG: OpgC domain-containing protein [Candidatus Kapaibacteriota bacterium]
MNIIPNEWQYIQDGTRDLRIDFLRGFVMLILVVVHFDFFSLYNFIAWERIGVIAGAEGFVILSGFVVGMLYGNTIRLNGWHGVTTKLWKRALKLYRANLGVILSVALLSLLPFWSAWKLMVFTDVATSTVYQLYPQPGLPFPEALVQLLRLQFGPHQFQIMGLYVVLLFITPALLWILHKRLVILMLVASWAMYVYNIYSPSMPTGAQFEYGFPILTWQILYLHGLAAGYYKESLAGLMGSRFRTLILVLSGILFFGFMFFTLNNPNPEMPAFARLSLIPPEVFGNLYNTYFLKNTLGILRLVNYLVVLVYGSYILTICWKPLNKAFGWFFLPIGQASLYVFIMHIFVLYVVSNIPIFWQQNFFINTLGHTASLLVLWLLVRYKVLFEYIPH